MKSFSVNESVNGLNEKQLLFLCDEKNANRGVFPWVYWTSELYSFGKYIRKYGYYPPFLPLTVYSDHSGPVLEEEPYKHELECGAPYFLTHSKKKSENYIFRTGKKSLVMFSPSVFYRRSNNINKSNNAKGTIAFPVHTLPNFDEIFDVEKYIEELINLPEKFQPVSVCLHMHDINKGRHNFFLDSNIGVYTAGNSSDVRFIERLYSIIKNFNYTTSNHLGTITFYSIEMGIPFFICGEKQIDINKDDNNLPIGLVIENNNSETDFFYEKLLLKNISDTIDGEVINYIERKLGIYDGLSRNRLALVLWKSFIVWLFSARSLSFFKLLFMKVVNKFI